MKHPEIKTAVIECDFMPDIPRGWGNGYVGVPQGHPWWGKDYDHIEADVHGGLTYSRNYLPGETPATHPGYWWVGFDCLHSDDTMENRPKSFVLEETERLRVQAEKAW